MGLGLVIGKFVPVHNGHCCLVETALANAEQVVILVCDHPRYSIPVAKRVAWLQEIAPSAKVISIPDIGKDDDSEAWGAHTLRFLSSQGLPPPSVVFTSEAYGAPYAAALGCLHFSVDPLREKFPISGSAVLRDPLANWQHLPLPVRAYFAKRICVLGAESTGTTTLARTLAEHYRTCWVPEFGRLYSEGKLSSGAEWRSEEFDYIARCQDELEELLARSCNRVLICDTDSFATELWHERYLGKMRQITRKQTYCDLYILTSPDIPFVQDGFRDGEHLREWMHERFQAELKVRRLNHLVLIGSHAQRMAAATSMIDQLLLG